MLMLCCELSNGPSGFVKAEFTERPIHCSLLNDHCLPAMLVSDYEPDTGKLRVCVKGIWRDFEVRGHGIQTVRIHVVVPGYNNIGTCDTSPITSGIPWHQFFPHC